MDRIAPVRSEVVPLGEGFSLVANQTLIYDTTFGVFGQVIEWTMAALSEMVAQKCPALTLDHFLETRLQIQLPETLTDIVSGESLATKLKGSLTPEYLAELHAKLHQKVKQGRRSVEKVALRRRRRKPFARRPAR